MVTRYDWPEVTYQTEENNGELLSKTDGLQLQIQKVPLTITVFDANGKLLSSENLEGTERSGVFKNQAFVGTIKRLLPDQHFFGFGE